jgi:class 3 adenylate cyclase
MQFSDELFYPNSSRKDAGFAIKISGRHHSSIRRLETQLRWFRLSGALLLLAYCATAFYLWLFGRHLRFSARRKLAMILGLIVILPVLGVGALTFLALQSSGRVIENHLVQFTQNNVHQMALFDEENQLRKMGAGTEVKRRLEADTAEDNELFPSLARPGDNLDWFSTWTNSMSECRDNGVMNQYSGFRMSSAANRLVQNLLDKYMDSLGLFKSASRSDVSRTMTLGMLENYLTPALEEACIVHEGTLQREVTHSADTSMANLLVVKSGSGRYWLMYHRVSGLGEHVNRYLSRLGEKSPEWFVRRGLYGTVNVGVRLRKVADLQAFTWPADSLLSPAMDFSFERAISLRDQGHGVIKRNGELEVRAWRYETGRSAVIAATGKSDGVRLAYSDLAIRMLFPVLVGYAILLLYFVTSVIVEFISGPVRIINKGIQALNQENYGVMLAGFSEDEFAKVTTAFNEMSIALKQREMMKRYVSGDLIEKVAIAGSAAGETRMARVAVLASDVRSFTVISEKYSPAEVVDMLNSYFTSMEEAITGQGGIIDKYIGDAVQAVFYDDPALDNYVLRACRAATQMRCNLVALNGARREQGLFTIENGVGIDCGLAVSGSIGSEAGRKDFTVVGRVIEQAAALESLTVNTASRILISVCASREAGQSVIVRDFNSAAVELCDV